MPPCARSCRCACSGYGSAVPPCFDVYIWVRSGDRPGTLARFIDQYVDRSNPGDPRFDAFLRTFVACEPQPGDLDALAELRWDPDADSAFSLYLRALNFYEAIVTLTEEGDLVLGLGLDDPTNDPAVVHRASTVLAELVDAFGASAGIGGVELPPPQSRMHWAEDGDVVLRVGSI